MARRSRCRVPAVKAVRRSTLDDTLAPHYVRQEDVARALDELTRAAHRPVRRGSRGGRGARSAAGRARRADGADAGRAARAARASVTGRHRRSRAGPVLVDVQATQSASHRDRGVARYTAELAAALWRGHRPLVHSFLLNPDLAPPGSVEPLVASGRLAYSDRVRLRRRRGAAPARRVAVRARRADRPAVAGRGRDRAVCASS